MGYLSDLWYTYKIRKYVPVSGNADRQYIGTELRFILNTLLQDPYQTDNIPLMTPRDFITTPGSNHSPKRISDIFYRFNMKYAGIDIRMRTFWQIILNGEITSARLSSDISLYAGLRITVGNIVFICFLVQDEHDKEIPDYERDGNTLSNSNVNLEVAYICIQNANRVCKIVAENTHLLSEDMMKRVLLGFNQTYLTEGTQWKPTSSTYKTLAFNTLSRMVNLADVGENDNWGYVDGKYKQVITLGDEKYSELQTNDAEFNVLYMNPRIMAELCQAIKILPKFIRQMYNKQPESIASKTKESRDRVKEFNFH